MKFLLDVCTGGYLTNWLREKGFDVKEVREKDKSMTDEDVVKWAEKDNRIIITLDKDFGEIYVANGRKLSIIRMPDVSAEQRIKLMELILNRYSNKLQQKVIITVSEKRVRIRELNNYQNVFSQE
jgi:predicted nuclease of predicted toxin-antitoxin system